MKRRSRSSARRSSRWSRATRSCASWHRESFPRPSRAGVSGPASMRSWRASTYRFTWMFRPSGSRRRSSRVRTSSWPRRSRMSSSTRTPGAPRSGRPWTDGLLRVEVRDDGLGGADPEGHGLVGMADRVTALGGRLDIESPADGGTLLAATLPVSPCSPGASAGPTSRAVRATPDIDFIYAAPNLGSLSGVRPLAGSVSRLRIATDRWNDGPAGSTPRHPRYAACDLSAPSHWRSPPGGHGAGLEGRRVG